MGAGKSSKIKPLKELSIVQQKIQNKENINEILKEHPSLEEFKFTKSGLNFLHYI